MKFSTVLSVSTFATAAVGAVSPAEAASQYVYDSAGRLMKIIYSNGVTIEYRYDAAGNRKVIVSGP